MKVSTDITKKEGHEQLPLTPNNEEEEMDKYTKVNKVCEEKTERLNQLKQYLKAQLNIPEHTKGESLQQALQKIGATQLKQLVQQFNQMQQKSSFSTPTAAAEKEVLKVQPLREVSANESKMKVQMKMLNDLLHRLAATKANTNSGAFNCSNAATNGGLS